MHGPMTHTQIFFLLLFACSGYALLRGGAPERVTALVFLAAGTLTPLVLPPLMQRYHVPEAGEIGIDIVLYVTLLAVAFHANRYWPIWMSALQGIQVLSHFVGMIHSPGANIAYAVLAHFLCYPMLLILVIGTRSHQLKLSRTGADRSWSNSSDLSTMHTRNLPGP